MKKIFRFLFLLLCFASTGQAQVVLDPPFHAFGSLRPGKEYVVKVKITNPTEQTLTMGGLRAQCDCTKASIAKATLKPHTFTTLTLKYHPAATEKGWKNYELTFKVYQQGSDKNIHSKTETFRYSAQLNPAYSLEPDVIDAGYVLNGNPTRGKGVLTVDPVSYPAWRPATVLANPTTFAANIKPLAKAGTYEVVVDFPKTLAPGNYEGTLEIKGKGPKDASFSYPFKGTVGSSWNASPDHLSLPDLTAEKSYKGWKETLLVRNLFGKPFKVLRVEGMPAWLKCDIHQENIGFVLRFELEEGKLKGSEENPPKSLQVVTDLKGEDAFPLPVQAAGKPKE